MKQSWIWTAVFGSISTALIVVTLTEPDPHLAAAATTVGAAMAVGLRALSEWNP